MSRKYPQALLWIDLETPGLPEGNDFSKVSVMEAAGVVTDFDLVKFTGFHECAKLNKEHAALLKVNDVVLDMHKKSGLLADCAKSTQTERDLEEGLVQLLKDSSFDKGEYMIAGSGVAAFDHPLIKQRMPELASWLAYYPLDIGILRRTLYVLGHGRGFVKPVKESFKEGYKKHRAMSDVLAHIEEAETYKEWLRNLPED